MEFWDFLFKAKDMIDLFESYAPDISIQIEESLDKST